MDKTEAYSRAQSGERPEGGFYSNSERIALQNFSLGRISTLPSSIFGNRRGGGLPPRGGGAIIVRPQASLVDNAQNQQIKETQQSVGLLQNILDVIRINLQSFGSGINNIRNQFLLQGQVEEKNLKDERETERKLLEKKIRLGRENELERKITSSLARPIVSIQRKVASIFERIMSAMTTLFFGWLANQGVEALKAYSSRDSKKLEEIKNNVIKNILYSIGALAAIKVGFGLVMRTITGLTFTVIGLGARLALSPFRALGGLISRILGIGGRAAAPAARSGARVPITGSANFLSRLFNIGRGGTGAASGGLGKIGSRIVPGLNIALGGAATAYDLNKGNYGKAFLSAVSMVPGPIGWAGLGGRLLYGAATGEYSGDQQTPAVQPQTPAVPPPAPAPAPAAVQPQTPAAPSPAPAAVQPQTPAVPPPPSAEMTKKFQMAWDKRDNPLYRGTIESAWNNMTPEQQQQAKDWAKSEGHDWTKMRLESKEVAIQSPNKPITDLGSLPEPKPNIIVAGGGRDRTQVSSPSQQPVTDVPLIPSANTDNFYVLYSQLSYNVVI